MLWPFSIIDHWFNDDHGADDGGATTCDDGGARQLLPHNMN
jgi:hypothetical protein